MSSPEDRALQGLPHGPEFRFIDRITTLAPGQRGTGEYLLRGDEPFLLGHFPSEAMMPGVLLVEAIAQLAGAIAQSDPEHPPLKGLKLTAIRGAKISGTAKPGQRIDLNAQIIARMQNLVQAEGAASVDGNQILQVQVALSGDSQS